VDILDTAGSDEFKMTRESNLKSRDGFIFVYDVNNNETLLKLNEFMHVIE
jgi:GTPase SAR1 family protein